MERYRGKSKDGLEWGPGGPRTFRGEFLRVG